MSAKTRERLTIRDFLGDNPQVICTETFAPWMQQTVERGRYFRLDAPIVRAWPEYFAIVVPVSDVLEKEE
jgi:hypothetical protein